MDLRLLGDVKGSEANSLSTNALNSSQKRNF